MTRLDLRAILHDLGSAGVHHVITGSVAAAAYRVPVVPRDLDIAPDLDRQNLARLAAVLCRWSASPVPDPDWSESLSPAECERWTPDPPTAEHLDHLYMTPHGLFDVVPTRSLAYRDLTRRALPVAFEQWMVWVAHPGDLIATLRIHKAKHQARLVQLREVSERLERGEPVTPDLQVASRPVDRGQC